MKTILLSYNRNSKIHPPQENKQTNKNTSVFQYNKNAGFPRWLSVKNRLQCRRYGFNPWVRKIPWTRAWQPTPVFLPGESHGQRSLVGFSPWGHRVGRYWRNWACTAHTAEMVQVTNNSNFYRFIREAFFDMGSDTSNLKDRLTTCCRVWIREGQE